jgi:tripartite-type tricarboxylate transporter receptor subunit TctC
MTRHLLVAAALAAIVSSPAVAADPARPLAGQTITIVEPFGRDSITDKTLRLLAPGMEKALGAKIAIAYQRSPVGTEAYQRVAKAKPDGTTLLVIADATRLFHENLAGAKDKLEALTPVAKLTDGISLALVTRAGSPLPDYKTLFLKMRDEKLRPTLSLTDAASPAGVFAAILEDDTSGRFGPRQFQVDRETIDDLEAGKVDLAILPTPILLDRARKLRGLLTSGARRHPALPDVPTFVEESHKRKLSFTIAVGLYGPAGMPPAMVAALHAAAKDAAAAPAAKSGANAAGLPVVVNDAAILREAMARTRRVISDLLAP